MCLTHCWAEQQQYGLTHRLQRWLWPDMCTPGASSWNVSSQVMLTVLGQSLLHGMTSGQCTCDMASCQQESEQHHERALTAYPQQGQQACCQLSDLAGLHLLEQQHLPGQKCLRSGPGCAGPRADLQLHRGVLARQGIELPGTSADTRDPKATPLP